LHDRVAAAVFRQFELTSAEALFDLRDGSIEAADPAFILRGAGARHRQRQKNGGSDNVSGGHESIL
jgi:hypothetical protein